MKVYTRKPYREPIIPSIIATLAFLIGPMIVFYNFINDYIDPVQAINEYGTPMLFSITFFAFGLSFLYFLFKPPKSYRARLMSAAEKHYHGRLITEFKFQIPEAGTPNKETDSNYLNTYRCYTYDHAHLYENNEYILVIKEFSKRPRYVKEFSEPHATRISDTAPSITIKPVFFAIGFIFFGHIILAIISFILMR